MRIPLFPLRLVVFPDEKLNLHIFDPKYLSMVEDCILSGNTFGIPAFIDESMMRVGTEMKVLEIVNEYDSGERDIKTVAVGLFEIDSIQDKATKFNCDVGQINPYFLINDQDDFEVHKLVEKVNILFRSLKVKELNVSEILKPVSFSLGHVIGLSLNQEYDLICLKKESERIGYLIEYIDGIMPEEKVREIIMRKVNLNGHFKNVIPPRLE